MGCQLELRFRRLVAALDGCCFFIGTPRASDEEGTDEEEQEEENAEGDCAASVFTLSTRIVAALVCNFCRLRLLLAGDARGGDTVGGGADTVRSES